MKEDADADLRHTSPEAPGADCTGILSEEETEPGAHLETRQQTVSVVREEPGNTAATGLSKYFDTCEESATSRRA